MYELLTVTRERAQTVIDYYGPNKVPALGNEWRAILNAALADNWEPLTYTSDGARRERFVFRRVVAEQAEVETEAAPKKRGPGRPRKES